MRVSLLLVTIAVILSSHTTVSLTQCDITLNGGGGTGYTLYNSVCTDPALPYCTFSGIAGVSYCTSCASEKTSLCDCPANFFCLNGEYNPQQTGDFCTPMPTWLYGQACSTHADCDYILPKPFQGINGTAKRFDCIDNVCRFCNYLAYGSAIFCEQARAGNPADFQSHGSQSSDEARACFSQTNAWNTIEWPATIPIPTDPYILVVQASPSQGASATPTGTRAPSTSPTNTRAPSASQSPLPAGASQSTTSTLTTSATPSLSIGASPSVSPQPVNAESTASIVTMTVALALCIACVAFVA